MGPSSFKLYPMLSWHRTGCVLFVLTSIGARCAWTQKPLNDPPKLSGTPAPQKADVYYAGAFEGKELGKEWKLLNPDPERWTMEPKHKSIMIITQKSSCSTKGKNVLVLDKQLPPDDFEVVVKASILAQGGAGNEIALMLFSDDTNYFWIPLQRRPYYDYPANIVYFQKGFKGNTTGSFESSRISSNFVYLKIVKDGNNYSGSYAGFDPAKVEDTEKIQWIALGTLPLFHFQSKLALCADNFQDAPEVSAEFYSVVIRKK